MISRRLAALVAVLCTTFASACTSPQAMNAISRNDGYRLEANRVYDYVHALSLDVYSPSQISGAPVVVFFYGGRWSSGNKAEFRFVGQALASRGFVTVIPDLRQYPQVRFPAFVDDAARAVAWARENASAYGGDPQQLFVMGHSSGAHVAAMLALDEEYLKKAGGSRRWLRGMIGLAGAYDFMPITAPDLRDLFGPVDRFHLSQPVFFTDGQNPPLLLIHGRNDEVLWVDNTIKLARAVSNAGGPVETVIYDRLSHSAIINSLASFMRARADVLDNIEEFVLRVAKAPPPAPRAPEIRGTPLTPENPDEEPPAPQPLQIETYTEPLQTPEPTPEPGPETAW